MNVYFKMKKLLKSFLPDEWAVNYRKINSFLLHKKNKNKTTLEVFSEIYSKNLWGEPNKSGEFYSGPGSEGIYADKYVEKINSFIKSLGNNNFNVIDLGCGDFRIGERIAKENNINYIGIDIVPELIERNKNKYKDNNIKFLCLDIVSENLPNGDICLVREVLQHLSNSEIEKILEKLKKYKYIFVTESHPLKIIKYNEDKPHGQDTRANYGSGVYLDKPPFNIPDIERVMSIPRDSLGPIETFLIKN